MVLDLTETAHHDEADSAVVATVKTMAGSVAAWRAWRPRTALNPSGPARIYLLQAEAAPAELVTLTATVQDVLLAAGIAHPQVEVFASVANLTVYQRSALARSALLWAAQEPGQLSVARVFDRVDPFTGPDFAADHELLSEGDEPRWVLDYLANGHVLLSAAARSTDVFDAGLGEVVPLSIRTDGAWIWTDTVTYYLEEYALSPDAGLLEHIRDQKYRVPAIDAVAVHRAFAKLIASAQEPPAWTAGTDGAP
jgi:hypothetical protein